MINDIGYNCNDRTLFNLEDTLILLGDEDQGIAIPLKGMFDKFTRMTFGEEIENSEEEVE